MITPGDIVQPKPEYASLNQVPTGKVIAVVPFGKEGAVYVEGEPRAFIAECFDIVKRTDPTPPETAVVTG